VPFYTRDVSILSFGHLWIWRNDCILLYKGIHYQMKKKRGETLVFSKVLHKYVGRRKAEFLPYPAQKTKGAAAETSVGTVHPSANTCVKMRLRRQ
jgi:hypothetical protein